MKIYESAVRKPISTILLFVGVIVFGLYSLMNLAVDQYPEIEIPQISVITMYPGANAADIETNITRVLEDNLNTVNNLKKLTSKSQDNVSMITVEFEYGSDLNEGANEIRDVVSRVQSMLPDDVDYPTIFKFSTSMIPVMMLAVTADESYPALNKILDDKLVNVLNRVDGVGAVSIVGAPEREIQVNVDPAKLDAYGLTVEQLGQLIAAENVNIPSGTIDIGNNTFNIKADGEFKLSDELRKVVVSNAGGRTVMLTDVAEIRDTLEKATMDERVNGKRGVRVIFQKQSGSNTVNIVHEIQNRLPEIQRSLPKDVKMELIYEASQEITDAIGSLSETIMYAFIFVVLVVMIFLGRWRATFIICMTIPVSLICSFIYLFATGSTLNIISLSSLSIAIGMVVDDAIVVLENITSHIERGSNPKEAAIYATNEVWLSVIATTLVVVAVFLPLTMVPGMAGILFRELGWIVTIVVCVSTTAAITLTPMMSAYLLKLEGGIHDYKGIGIVYKPIDRALEWLDNAYARTLNWVVHHRRITFGCMMALFLASLGLVTQVPTEFFPPADNSRISATVKLEQNLSMEYTAQVARQIDSILYEKYPEVIIVSASAGANSSDNAFAAMQTTGSHIINYNMRLTDTDERDRSIFVISDLLRKDLDNIPEVRQYTVTPGGMSGGMSGSSTADIKVFGYNMDQTNAIANDLKEKLAALDGTRDVQLSRDDLRPEYNVVFDRDRLAYWHEQRDGGHGRAQPHRRTDGLEIPRGRRRIRHHRPLRRTVPHAGRGRGEHHALQHAGPPCEAQGSGQGAGRIRGAGNPAREPPASNHRAVDLGRRRGAGRRGKRNRRNDCGLSAARRRGPRNRRYGRRPGRRIPRPADALRADRGAGLHCDGHAVRVAEIPVHHHVHHPVRIHGRVPCAVDDLDAAVAHRAYRSHHAGGYRNEERYRDGGLHEPAYRTRLGGIRRGDCGRQEPSASGADDLVHHGAGHAAAGHRHGCGLGDVAADGYRRHRRSDFLDHPDALHRAGALLHHGEPRTAQGA